MTSTSYLTQAEIELLQTSKLSRETPFAIQGVSRTQFSIAKYYGGIKYNGQSYTHFPEQDELVRDDVLKFITKHRKPAKKRKNRRSLD